MDSRKGSKRTLGWIYLLENPNGQIYVGQTRNLGIRMEYYKRLDCKSQKLLYASLCQFGFTNHKLTILKRCAYSTLDKWELHYINTSLSCYRDSPLGLNILKESYEDYCKLRGRKKKTKRKKRKGYSFKDII